METAVIRPKKENGETSQGDLVKWGSKVTLWATAERHRTAIKIVARVLAKEGIEGLGGRLSGVLPPPPSFCVKGQGDLRR